MKKKKGKKMDLNNGFFITVEGIDGVGKSTLVNSLARHFNCSKLMKGLATIIGQENYDEFKEIVHSRRGKQLIDFYSSSYKLSTNEERIFADRYIGSLYSWGVDDNNESYFFEKIKDLRLPDFAIFLIGDPDVIYERTFKRDNSVEEASKSFLIQEHLKKYIFIYDHFKIPYVIIDTTFNDKDKTFTEALKLINEFANK